MNAINDNVLKLLAEVNKNVDLTHELQTEIAPEVFFKRNSVNLLIGKKGSGKTYNVFREVLKLKWVPNHRYTKMLYVTNKPYDPTYARIKDLMPIPVEKVPYEQAVEKINEVSEAKKAMVEIKEHNIDVNDLDHTLLDSVLGQDIAVDAKTGDNIYHTIVLLDDCAFLFERRTRQNMELWKLLFENRQPKITYFLTMQDAKGLDTSIKEALDTVWLFGGFTPFKFNYLMRSIPHETPNEELFEVYCRLTKNQALVFFNNQDGTEVLVLRC